MSSKLSLEELKIEYVGKVLNFLTVTDVIRDNTNRIRFVCKCKCGNIKCIDKNKVLRGDIKSCGCFNTVNKNNAVLELRREYLDKTFNWLKVVDVLLSESDNSIKFKCVCRCGNTKYVSLRDLKSGKLKSCGCYIKSKERAEKYKQWRKNNPDKIIEINNKHKQWFKDHPEKVKEQAQRYYQWCKEHPDKVKEIANKHSEWYKNNPEKTRDIGKRHSKWFKDHPDKVKSIVRRRSYTISHNSDIMTKFSLNRSLCYNQKRVHDIKCLIDSPTKDFEDLVAIIRPDQLQQFLDGKIDTHSFIYTRCPLCNKYFPHLLKNTFVIKSGTYKRKVAPMCDNCTYSYTKSNSERNIRDYISSFYDGKCIENSRDIIPPFELDLYYPEKKIAIEFNGDYWHSLKFKNRGYHYNKFKMCLNNGILLISIFETEWEVNCDKIKGYIKDTFNGKQSELSIDNGLMNNNYPIYNIRNHHIDEYIEDYYTRGKDCKIYTCGFSRID